MKGYGYNQNSKGGTWALSFMSGIINLGYDHCQVELIGGVKMNPYYFHKHIN